MKFSQTLIREWNYLSGIKYVFSYLKRKLYWGLQLGVGILPVSFSFGHLKNQTLALSGSPFLDGGLTIMAKHYWQKSGMDLCDAPLLENAIW